MKVVKFKVWCNTGFSGCDHEATLELQLEGDETAEEIEGMKQELTMDWLFNKIDYGYE